MPGNIIAAAPTQVMPAHLSRAFHEESHMECDLNIYADGSTDRRALATNTRRYFTMQQFLPPDQWDQMRTFYFANQGRPFYFYNLRETVPPFSFDPTGQNPIGRYIVAFDGQWSDSYGHERAQMIPGAPGTAPVFKGYAASVSLGLREIA